MHRSQRVKFKNEKGVELAGIIEWPVKAFNDKDVDSADEAVRPVAFCSFAHCFTCTKDLKTTVRISRRLARRGFAVLRFDFTGLAHSGGRFSESTFEDNCVDVLAAAHFLKEHFEPPKFLIGHSLGGGAQMAMANQIESAIGLITIASPSDTHHLAKNLAQMNPEIVDEGEGVVTIGGSEFLIRQPAVKVLKEFDLAAAISQLTLPQLIIHSPSDATLSYKHALRIAELTRGDVSLMTLTGSDHLLLDDPNDIEFVSEWIALWARRMLGLPSHE